MNRAEFESLLQRDGLLCGPLPAAAPDGGPWYLQAVSGFGAWLAALLVLSMLGGLLSDLWSSMSARLLVGGALCAGAAFIARSTAARPAGTREGAFLAQFTLAFGLAGIALVGSAIFDGVRGNVPQATALAALAAVLLVANPERVHRAFMAWMLVVAGTSALWMLRLEPAVSIVLAVVTAALWLGQARCAAAGLLPVTAPIGVACAGVLVLLQVPDVVPRDVAADVPFALDGVRSAMLRCLGIAAVLAVAGVLIARRVAIDAQADVRRAPYVLAVFCAVLAAAAWRTPGIVACLLVWLLGVWAGRSQLVWYGLAGLAAYLGMRYYALDMTLMHKGVAMIVVAGVLLGARFLLPLVWPQRADR